jgi:hypothetical protein
VASPLSPHTVLVSRTLEEEEEHMPSRAHTNMTGEVETPREALLEATIKNHRKTIIFQKCQEINQLPTSKNMSYEDKRLRLMILLPASWKLTKAFDYETENMIKLEFNWSTADQNMLEKIARLTPLDDDILFGYDETALATTGRSSGLGEWTLRDFLWCHRYHATTDSRLLAKFLKIINWGDHVQVREARQVMSRWTIIRPEMCLELLGSSFSDPIVRAYACLQLSKMRDIDLAGYMLQLVQCLKIELYDDSVLLRFMLRRSLRNPLVVGHKLFWLLRSELHTRESLGRYGLLLEMYVMHCGPHRFLLTDIHHTVHSLERVTSNICALGKKDKKGR